MYFTSFYSTLVKTCSVFITADIGGIYDGVNNKFNRSYVCSYNPKCVIKLRLIISISSGPNTRGPTYKNKGYWRRYTPEALGNSLAYS